MLAYKSQQCTGSKVFVGLHMLAVDKQVDVWCHGVTCHSVTDTCEMKLFFTVPYRDHAAKGA